MKGRSFILENQSLPMLTTWFSYEGLQLNESTLGVVHVDQILTFTCHTLGYVI